MKPGGMEEKIVWWIDTHPRIFKTIMGIVVFYGLTWFIVLSDAAERYV